jgi:hypothetical protein
VWVRRRAARPSAHRGQVPDAEWVAGRGGSPWAAADITALLDAAQHVLLSKAAALRIEVEFIRKERSIGIIKRGDSSQFTYTALEEIALGLQSALRRHPIPHCAFNGGNDVWVDVGTKALGIRAVQAFIGVRPAESVHVGDRFTRTGNDTAARQVTSGARARTRLRLRVCTHAHVSLFARLLLTIHVPCGGVPRGSAVGEPAA